MIKTVISIDILGLCFIISSLIKLFKLKKHHSTDFHTEDIFIELFCITGSLVCLFKINAGVFL